MNKTTHKVSIILNFTCIAVCIVIISIIATCTAVFGQVMNHNEPCSKIDNYVCDNSLTCTDIRGDSCITNPAHVSDCGCCYENEIWNYNICKINENETNINYSNYNSTTKDTTKINPANNNQTKSNSSCISKYTNQDIVNAALTYKVGSYGDQCKIFVQNVIKKAGGSLGAGYKTAYLEAIQNNCNTGKEIFNTKDVGPGTIIQLSFEINESVTKNGTRTVHSAIVLKNNKDGSFEVIDSNFGYPNVNETISIHNWTPRSGQGFAPHYYSLGKETNIQTDDNSKDNSKISQYILYYNENDFQMQNSSCQKCGERLFNICDKKECEKLSTHDECVFNDEKIKPLINRKCASISDYELILNSSITKTDYLIITNTHAHSNYLYSDFLKLANYLEKEGFKPLIIDINSTKPEIIKSIITKIYRTNQIKYILIIGTSLDIPEYKYYECDMTKESALICAFESLKLYIPTDNYYADFDANIYDIEVAISRIPLDSSKSVLALYDKSKISLSNTGMFLGDPDIKYGPFLSKTFKFNNTGDRTDNYNMTFSFFSGHGNKDNGKIFIGKNITRESYIMFDNYNLLKENKYSGIMVANTCYSSKTLDSDGKLRKGYDSMIISFLENNGAVYIGSTGITSFSISDVNSEKDLVYSEKVFYDFYKKLKDKKSVSEALQYAKNNQLMNWNLFLFILDTKSERKHQEGLKTNALVFTVYGFPHIKLESE